jgi:hypothetical protein
VFLPLVDFTLYSVLCGFLSYCVFPSHIKQYLHLLSSFSRHISSRPSFSSTTLSTTTEADRDHINVTCTWPKEGRAINTGALISRGSKPLSGDNDSGLSDSDPDLSSNDETDIRARADSAVWVRGDEYPIRGSRRVALTSIEGGQALEVDL